MTDPKLRDVELLQWMADFLTEMFNVEKTDVSGAQKPQTTGKDEAGAATRGEARRKKPGKPRVQKSSGSVFSLSE